MLASTRVLNQILDHLLRLLPDDPADSKRLDDIIDVDASGQRQPMIAGSGVQQSAVQQSELPESSAQQNSVQHKLRAAS